LELDRVVGGELIHGCGHGLQAGGGGPVNVNNKPPSCVH
jgi:hypothetical protein